MPVTNVLPKHFVESLLFNTVKEAQERLDEGYPGHYVFSNHMNEVIIINPQNDVVANIDTGYYAR